MGANDPPMIAGTRVTAHGTPRLTGLLGNTRAAVARQAEVWWAELPDGLSTPRGLSIDARGFPQTFTVQGSGDIKWR